MPKKQILEPEKNILNIKELHKSIKEDGIYIDYENNVDRKSIQLSGSQNKNKTTKYSKTTWKHCKTTTNFGTTSSIKPNQSTSFFSLIPFYYDEDDNNNNNDNNDNDNHNDNDNEQSEQKALSKKVKSIIEEPTICNTNENQTNGNVVGKISSLDIQQDKTQNKNTEFINSNYSFNDAKQIKSVLSNKKPINNTQLHSKCIMVKKNLSHISFENSIIKRNENQFTNINHPKLSNNSLLFTVIQDDDDEVIEKVLPSAYISNQHIILDDDIKNNKKLVIENHSGNLIRNNKKLVINAAGLDKGKRNKRDGFTYFGYHQGKNGAIINDYILHNEKNPFIHNVESLFSIEFSVSQQAYYIHPYFNYTSSNFSNSSIQKTHLIFRKIEEYLWITERHFVQIGKTLFIFDPYEQTLILNAFHKGEDNPTTYEFKIRDKVTIGNADCQVVIEEEVMECILQYDQYNQCWKLKYNTNVHNNDQSTHAWVLIDSKEEILDNYYIKIGKNVIRLNFI